MRILLLPLIALTACGEAPPETKAEAAPPATLPAGQWEVTREVVKFTALDDGKPAIAAKAGDKTTSSVCVAPADTAKPEPELIGGNAADGCTYDTLYLADGRINASLACAPKSMRGKLFVSSSGTYTADSMELTLASSTQLAGTGDVRVDEKISAKLTGPTCTGLGAATGAS